MIRFLASLNRPELDAAAVDATRRLGEPVHLALADGLARRGVAAASHVPALRSLGFKDTSWNVFYGLTTSGTGALGPLGAAILRERDPHAWRVLLSASRRTGAVLDGGLAVAGVRSDVTEIRTETYWHLAIAFDSTRPADEALAAALGEAPEAGAETPADPGAALAFEVLQRLHGRPPRPALETLKALGPSLRKQIPWDVVSTRQLAAVFDKSEQKALSKAFFGRDGALDHWSSMTSVHRTRREGSYALVRTAGEFPARYVPDVLAAAGCEASKWGGILGGEVSYGADGRPRHVGLLPGRASKECLEAMRALLVSTLAPLGVPVREGEKSLMILPDRPEFLACLDETARLPLDRPWTVGVEEGQEGSSARLEEPRKIRNVPPEYPVTAKNQRVQGFVVLEATIAPSGCVSGVSLLAGVDTRLDLEALRAVSGWGYTPTLLDGTPVPVFMTVTVNYRLN